MKINLNIAKPSFGYDKNYHKYVEKSLGEQDTKISRRLSYLDSCACGLEFDVVQLEKTGKQNTDVFKQLTDLLIELRTLSAFNIAQCANYLKYPENIIKQYLSEMDITRDSINNHWRRDICEKVSKYSIQKYDYALNALAVNHKMPIKDEAKKKEITQNTSVDEIAAQAVDNYVSKTTNELLTKYDKTKTKVFGFQDVVGMDDVKLKFQEGILDYIYNPELATLDFVEYGIEQPKSFLLYGPPGCGKTHISEALAVESGLDMYKMDVSKLGSSYVNKTAQNIQSVLDSLQHIASSSDKPILLFMDEVDSLAIKRGKADDSSENLKTTTTLLKFLDEVKKLNVITIAATNKYDLLDEAFISRMSEQSYVGLPDKEQIKSLIKHTYSDKCKAKDLLFDEDSLSVLSEALKGYSNRSIVFILNNASRIAKRNNRSEINKDIVLKAIEESEFDKPVEKDFEKKSKNKVKIGFGFSD